MQESDPFEALQKEIQVHMEREKMTASTIESDPDGKVRSEKRPTKYRTEFKADMITVVHDSHSIEGALRHFHKRPQFLKGVCVVRVLRRDNIHQEPDGKWVWDDFMVREAASPEE